MCWGNITRLHYAPAPGCCNPAGNGSRRTVSATMNFDDKTKTCDSDPVKQERALAVAAVFR
jgi:hypothetical protein